MPKDPAEGAPGPAQLGRYRLISQIATGGMAEIYVARMEGYAGSRRLCVIKKIRSRIKADPRAVQMFLDEARIAATLQHPNIVQMFEVGEMDGNYFIAMEYLHGEDMRTVMKAVTRQQQQLPLDHALHITIDLLAGLHYAHEKHGIDGHPLGIVHRDVSPHNVFVTYDGAVKIVDFGIAKATNREHQTKVETLKGKIQYMSPEQCRCIAIDRRSDIFSVGVVLYELTTGHRLNSGDDEYEIMKRTVEGPLPRPTKLIEGYPAELENIVRKALAKKPEDRFETALEMQQALENFAHDFRLRKSSIELSKLMHGLFADRIESWERGVAEGTSIRQLVEARHDTRGETSGPTFETAASDPDRPSGQLITLTGNEHTADLDPRSGEIRDRRRANPSTTDLYPSISVADDYVSAVSTAGLPGIVSEPREPSPPPPAEPIEPSRPAASSRGGRIAIIAALVLLCSAAGVAVGVKLNAESAKNAAAIDASLAANEPIDAGVVVEIADAQPLAAIDAQAPAPLDAAPSAIAKKARLRVRTERGASIFIDGKRAGTAPDTIDGLTPGRRVVELRKAGFETARKSVRLRAGQTTTLRRKLKAVVASADPGSGSGSAAGADTVEKTEQPSGPGSLRIRSTPAAKVFVDGKGVGFTDWSRSVSAGRHAVRLAVPGGPEKTLQVTIEPGKPTKVICTVKDESYRCSVR